MWLGDSKNRKYKLNVIVPESWQVCFSEIKLVLNDVIYRPIRPKCYVRVRLYYNVLRPTMFTTTYLPT